MLAKTRTPGLVEDGRLPRVIDDTLVAMQVIAEDGATLGTIVNWSSHPEALGGANTFITSDFPHFLRDADGRAARGHLASSSWARSAG